jgi:regulator of sirC expression with transglutaminase-like and TPR domain
VQAGRLLTHRAVARRRFVELAQRPEELLDLSEASLVVALEECPGLDLDHYLGRFSEWSSAIRSRIDGSRDAAKIVEALNRFLFEEEGFHGEGADDYYDPRAVLLNEVLDRHAGLPLSLSILYIELSRRLGLEASGIAFPGRCLVRLTGPFGQILIDPFDDGRVLSAAECQTMLDDVYGGGVRLHEHHLRAFPRRNIIARLLSHLKKAYLAQHDLERAAASVDRLLILDDRDSYELRDRAALAMQLHAYRDAIDYLERYLAINPDVEDRPRVVEEIVYLRAWMDQN